MPHPKHEKTFAMFFFPSERISNFTLDPKLHLHDLDFSPGLLHHKLVSGQHKSLEVLDKKSQHYHHHHCKILTKFNLLSFENLIFFSDVQLVYKSPTAWPHPF